MLINCSLIMSLFKCVAVYQRGGVSNYVDDITVINGRNQMYFSTVVLKMISVL